MGMPEILEKVAEETEIYLDAGVDGLVLENMHDTPYYLEQQLGPHIGAGMAVVARQVDKTVVCVMSCKFNSLLLRSFSKLNVFKHKGKKPFSKQKRFSKNSQKHLALL